ncbi:MAG: D-alanyl-D-alanine carboxypeptidase family protein [Eubacterium sp.]
MKKIITFLSVWILIFSLNIGSAFAASLPSYLPEEGVVIKEQSSGDVLAKQNENERYYPASTTKLMTALVTLDIMSEHLDESVVIGEEVTVFDYDSSTAKLEVDEKYTYRQLLYGLLLPSGNDAANTLATNVGKSIKNDTALPYQEAIDTFVERMNEKGTELGLTSTHFVNPHGLHDPDHYTTPEELLKISETALGNPEIAKITGTKTYEMKTSTGKDQKWQNSNMLLYPDLSELTYKIIEGSNQNPYYNSKATGGKTGNTDEGGRCLVFTAKDGDKAIIGVIMKGQKNKIFGQADDTISALSNDYTLTNWTDNNNLYQKIEIENVRFKDGSELTLKTDTPYRSMVEKDKEYAVEPHFNEGLFEEKEGALTIQQKINAGQQIGELVVYDGSEAIKSTPLYAENEMNVRTILDYLMKYWYIVTALLILISIGIFVMANKRKRARKRRRRNKIQH